MTSSHAVSHPHTPSFFFPAAITQREKEKQERLEHIAATNARADKHYKKSTMKYWGFLPWRHFFQTIREQQRIACEQSDQRITKTAFKVWLEQLLLRQQEREKEADTAYAANLSQRVFYKWRKVMLCCKDQLVQSECITEHGGNLDHVSPCTEETILTLINRKA